MRRAQRGLVTTDRGAQPGMVAGGQQRQMLGADQAGAGQRLGIRGLGQPGRVGTAQLQQQALGHVARADAGRVERLQQRQRGAQLVQVRLHLGRQPAQDFLQGRAQVAVLVQFVDQQRRQRGVARRGAGQHQLPEQVLAQGIGPGGLGQAGIIIGVDPARTRHFLDRGVALGRGFVVLHRRLALGFGLRLDGGRLIVAFQQRIVGEHLRDFRLELERGQLQQPDRLLQLRGQRQMLAGPQF